MKQKKNRLWIPVSMFSTLITYWYFTFLTLSYWVFQYQLKEFETGLKPIFNISKTNFKIKIPKIQNKHFILIKVAVDNHIKFNSRYRVPINHSTLQYCKRGLLPRTDWYNIFVNVGSRFNVVKLEYESKPIKTRHLWFELSLSIQSNPL